MDNLLNAASLNIGRAGPAVVIMSLIIGLVVYFAFLSPKNEDRFDGFLGKLYRLLTFRSTLAEPLLRLIYVLLATFYLLVFFVGGIMSLEYSPGLGMVAILIGLPLSQIVLRLVFEFILILLLICRNTSEINQKLNQLLKNQPKASVPPAPVVRPVVPAAPVPPQEPEAPPEPEAPAQPEVPTCKKCGATLAPGARFCMICGTDNQPL